MSLAMIHGKLSAADAVKVNEQAEFLEKVAEAEADWQEKYGEDDAAGRIMARGFTDELFKISQGPEPKVDVKLESWHTGKKPAPKPTPKPAARPTVPAPERRLKPKLAPPKFKLGPLTPSPFSVPQPKPKR